MCYVYIENKTILKTNLVYLSQFFVTFVCDLRFLDPDPSKWKVGSGSFFKWYGHPEHYIPKETPWK